LTTSMLTMNWTSEILFFLGAMIFTASF
jgi:hypothetical protein